MSVHSELSPKDGIATVLVLIFGTVGALYSLYLGLTTTPDNWELGMILFGLIAMGAYTVLDTHLPEVDDE